jgi:hypothetical protein
VQKGVRETVLDGDKSIDTRTSLTDTHPSVAAHCSHGSNTQKLLTTTMLPIYHLVPAPGFKTSYRHPHN